MNLRLRNLRKQRGLSQAALAQMAGVTQQAVAQYEAGRIPLLPIAQALARALGVTVYDLWPEESEEVKPSA